MRGSAIAHADNPTELFAEDKIFPHRAVRLDDDRGLRNFVCKHLNGRVMKVMRLSCGIQGLDAAFSAIAISVVRENISSFSPERPAPPREAQVGTSHRSSPLGVFRGGHASQNGAPFGRERIVLTNALYMSARCRLMAREE